MVEKSKATASIDVVVERGIVEFAQRLKLEPTRDALRLIVLAGVDESSHALLHILYSLRSNYGLHVIVVYAGSSREFERKFFNSLCQKYGFEAILEDAEGVENASSEIARNTVLLARFDALSKIKNADFGVTAQSPKDNAELLFRQLLDSEVVSEFQVLRMEDERRKIIRPLLLVPQKSIDQYVSDKQLNFIPKGCAADELSNVVRGKLIPSLETSFRGDTLSSVNRVAERVGRDEEYLWKEAITLVDNQDEAHSLHFIGQVPAGLRWRILLLIAEEQLGSSATDLSHDVLREISYQIENYRGSPKEFQVSDSLQYVFSEQGFLEFHCTTPRDHGVIAEFHTKANALDQKMEPSRLDVPGIVVRQYDDGSAISIEARVVDSRANPQTTSIAPADGNPHSMAKAYFDWGSIPPTSLLVRERRLGDRLLLADGDQRKVKRLLDERGIPEMLIERLPIVESNQRILWVPGVASAAFAHPSSEAQTLLELSYRRRE